MLFSPAKVLVAWVRVPGRSWRACWRFWRLAGDRPGRGGGLADEIGKLLAARGQRLHRLGTLDEQAVERGLVVVKLGGQVAGGAQARRQVLEGLGGLGRFALDARRLALDHVLQAGARERVERVEHLVEADERVGVIGGDRAAVGDRGRLGSGRLEHHVLVGDPGQRVLVDPRHRALPDGRRVRVDAHLHLGLTVGCERDRLHRPDLGRAHQHLVARDQPAGVDEVGVQRVGRAPPQHHHRHHDDRRHERGDRGDPRDHETFRVGIRAVCPGSIGCSISPLCRRFVQRPDHPARVGCRKPLRACLEGVKRWRWPSAVAAYTKRRFAASYRVSQPAGDSPSADGRPAGAGAPSTARLTSSAAPSAPPRSPRPATSTSGGWASLKMCGPMAWRMRRT